MDSKPDIGMDVTHILAPAPNGGLERVVEMLAVGHAARGHHISALAILPNRVPEPVTVARLRDGGVAVTVARVSGRAYLAERREFRAFFTSRARGLVHTHGYRADVLYSAVAAKLGAATVSTFHGFTGGDFKNRMYEYLQRRAARGFTRVVAVSRPIEERLRQSRVDPARLRCIPNAYTGPGTLATSAQSRARLALGPDVFTVGWVGRLSLEKGADVLLDALSRLRDLPMRAVFAGDGPETQRLRARTAALGLGRMVHWAGSIQGISEFYRAFDVVVISSRTEGTPIVLFEAMAAGVPIVASSVGGIPDVVTSAEAILVPSEDVDAIAAGIRAVFDRRAAATERADRATDVLRSRFALAPWLDRYEDVYRDALGACAAAP